MCAIFTVPGWRKLGNTGKKWLSLRFSDTEEGFSEGLESLKLKDRARASQSPLGEDPLPCFSPPPWHPMSHGFLNSSVSTQRCYLPNTLPTLSGAPRLCTAFPGGFVSCFKVNSGPTDPRAADRNKAVNCSRRFLGFVHTRPLPF